MLEKVKYFSAFKNNINESRIQDKYVCMTYVKKYTNKQLIRQYYVNQKFSTCIKWNVIMANLLFLFPDLRLAFKIINK